MDLNMDRYLHVHVYMCAVLLCLVCLFDLACLLLSFFLLIFHLKTCIRSNYMKHVHVYKSMNYTIHMYTCIYMYMYACLHRAL